MQLEGCAGEEVHRSIDEVAVGAELLARAEATGVWPETGNPVSKVQLTELHEHFLRHANAMDVAQREPAQLEGNAQAAPAA